MRIGPLPDVASGIGPGTPHDRLARWAVRLSAGCGALFVAAVAATAVGFGGAVAMVAFGGSFAAFVLAIVARVRRVRRAFLWLPLGVFPAMILCLSLLEAFWWE